MPATGICSSRRSPTKRGPHTPDNGCNFETFTNSDMLELESLGPPTTLAPGASVTHREDWYLFDGVKFEETDESIDRHVLTTLQSGSDKEHLNANPYSISTE